MKQITIEIKNSKVMRLIEDLAALGLIKIIKTVANEEPKKLSERLAGSITPAQAKKMHKELKEMRNEWERDIS
jgi:hypothetical protein